MGIGSADLRETLFTLLVLLLAPFPVYDEVPENQPFPFVALGESFESPSDVFDQQGRILLLVLHFYGQEQGWNDVLSAYEKVRAMLHRPASLPLSSWTFICSFQEYLGTIREPDGLTRHLVARFRFQIERH